ncbi:MAG: 1-acyl-sn-glycerol-3-phosphate acyltransferase [Myxococcales bacterium]|nr:MAG: 1-acyl-sn-glycerol-3-phosphate acyltransferase [Myxococcales bacterium]
MIIAAPHTSNWDFVWMMLFVFSAGIRIRFFNEKELFVGPMGWVFRKMGGVEVDRKRPENLVSDLARRFKTEKSLMLAIPPEGSRERKSYWKSGFYRIACEAKVPIVLCAFNLSAEKGYLWSAPGAKRRSCAGYGCHKGLLSSEGGEVSRSLYAAASAR